MRKMEEDMRHLSLRISKKVHQKYVEKAIEKSNQEKRIVKVSEVIREALEQGA